jgi:hypothetical protein
MAEVVDHLPSKHEALTLNPYTERERKLFSCKFLSEIIEMTKNKENSHNYNKIRRSHIIKLHNTF